MRGLNEPVSLAEVEEIYLPISRLLHLHVEATQALRRATETFLGTPATGGTYVIGIAGSVAVGKSTFSRVLRALIARWHSQPKVALVTTDGFLLPNRELESRGLLARKGFPESYDVRKLIAFMSAVAAGERASAPVYSHQSYDIVPGRTYDVDRPDVLIVEGLNVLQTSDGQTGRPPRVFVSDYFDFSIYIDADEHDIEAWYIARFQTLREKVFRDPRSYFHRYASLTDDQARETAREIWRTINGVNLRENISPTRDRARLVLEKAADHSVRQVRLRR